MSQPTQILDFLLLGSYGDSLRVRKNNTLAVTHILNVKDSTKFYEETSFASLHVPLSDYGGTELRQVLPACFKFIEHARETRGRVLVHCRSGQNRSATVVLGYLTFVCGLSLRESWELVSTKRPIVCVTEAYWRQLEMLERELKCESTFSCDELKQQLLAALNEAERDPVKR